jgi:hypothetical protein
MVWLRKEATTSYELHRGNPWLATRGWSSGNQDFHRCDVSFTLHRAATKLSHLHPTRRKKARGEALKNRIGSFSFVSVAE